MHQATFAVAKLPFQPVLRSRLNNNDITNLEATGAFKSLSQLKKM